MQINSLIQFLVLQESFNKLYLLYYDSIYSSNLQGWLLEN